MTTREAIGILMKHAGRNCQEVGVGVRSLPSEAEQLRVSRAVRKVWRLAYNREFSDGELQNLGLPTLGGEAG